MKAEDAPAAVPQVWGLVGNAGWSEELGLPLRLVELTLNHMAAIAPRNKGVLSTNRSVQTYTYYCIDGGES